jgi:hypothetical protein
MRRSVGVGMVVVGVLLATACGDRAEPGGGAPASDPPPVLESPDADGGTVTGATAATDATDELVNETAVAVATDPPDEQSSTTSSSDHATTIPFASEALGGVTVDDPLPPQPDALADPAGAEVAIRYAYQHWILVDLDPELRGRLVENGEAHVEDMVGSMSAMRGTIDAARLEIDRVTFLGATSATVEFRVMFAGAPSPYFPEPRQGDAIFTDGTWRIAAVTVCQLAYGVGSECKLLRDPNAPPVIAPVGLRLTAVPAGLLPSSGDDLITSMRYVDWIGPDPDRWLSVTMLPRPGLSNAGAAVIDDVLLQYAGGTGAAPMEIGGAPARAFRNDVPSRTSAELVEQYLVVIVRADDVVVQAITAGLSLDEVVSALGSLIPSDE